MNYLHPDVLDNGPAFIRNNAARALLLSAFMEGMTPAQMLAATLIAVDVFPDSFTLTDSGNDRQLTYLGSSGTANADLAQGAPLQIVLVDISGTVLWAGNESSQRTVEAGATYLLPSMTYLSPQPA